MCLGREGAGVRECNGGVSTMVVVCGVVIFRSALITSQVPEIISC